MTTADRTAGARLLRQLREKRCWSWADLARALQDKANELEVTSLADRQVASIQRTIARWESATARTSPSDRYQFLLAHLYARTPSGTTALGPGTDFGILLEAFQHFGTSADRIRELVELTSRNTDRIDAQHCGGDLLGTVAKINEQIGSTPFGRLQVELAPVVVACRRLPALETSDSLIRLATETFSLAARLAFETWDDHSAQALYAEATTMAGRLKDHRHRATVRTSHAMVTLHATDDPEAATQIARSATVDAHRGTSYAARARAHAVHAEVCARAGQAVAAGEALDRAWKTVAQEQGHGFNTYRLNGFDGLCALYTGDARRAQDKLDHCLAALRGSSRDAVQRGIVGTDLARARLRLGDPTGCADLLHETIDITATVGGRVAVQRIRQVRRELKPWRNEDFVAELDDHIHDRLIGR
ncbi:hypothetical protein [Kibdelosporangium aridum]|uniref:hypothetical protein n=1 Tax=Kibdelosporangium aridum TaxID=2030 RepID=UPI0035E6E363